MAKSSARTRRHLIQIGVAAWGAIFLGAIVLWILYARSLFDIWQLPLASIFVGLGGIGCVAFLLVGWMGKGSRKYLIFFVAVILALINGLAYFGAYTLTHFNDSMLPGLAFAPKPENARYPAEFGLDYATERIPINATEWLESWRIPVYGEARGTVLLFPGNGGNKAHQLMVPAQVFHNLGYHALMVDFRGQGGSSGNSSTLGLREAADVAYALEYAATIELPPPYVLYGLSLGSSAVLKAVNDGLTADALVLESPFAYLMNAVKTRMQAQDFPTAGIAELVVFWGSVQHGHNGFAHNPVNYAKSVKIPTLILHGENDRWTTVAEIEQIHQNLQGEKELEIFPGAGHNLLVTVDRDRWTSRVGDFLTSHLP
ncbi:MAG: alpha/beta fold hydrolase [Cyanobacteria bacterium P01_H01_bin.58]